MPTATDTLALEGGPKAFPGRTGHAEPKIGVAEFLSIARRFGFNDEAMARIASAVSDDDLPEGGTNLARYFSAKPAPAMGETYEAKAREKFGVAHALSVSSGTAALHAAMVAVGVAPGKEVILGSIGFLATAAAVALAGGTPVFCDVDESLQLDPDKLEPLINENTVAVAPTHLWGTVADVGRIVEVAHGRGVKVIEDCAQSPGAKHHGRYVGTVGDIGCFSISAYKIIGGGESGLLITDDERLYERAAQLAEAGGLWRPSRFAPPRYEGELFLGTNYRMSELEAAVNLVQLDKLDGIVERTRRANRRVREGLESFREITPAKSADLEGEVGYQLRMIPESVGLGKKIAEALGAEGIGASVRGPEPRPDWHVYSDMFPLAQAKPKRAARGDCPVADDLWRRALTMNVDQWWNDADCDAVAAGVNKVLRAYCTPGPMKRGWV